MDGDEVGLGRFRFDLRQRELRRDGLPVHLSNRARDILWVLACANGDVVSKDELMARVWPGLVVEENNIQVHISALRKALDQGENGHSYVVTVPGRGYRLVSTRVAPSFSVDHEDAHPRPVVPNKPSIAVLPFESLSSDPDQQYFADGVVEEII